jgi:hypothetical protein
MIVLDITLIAWFSTMLSTITSVAFRDIEMVVKMTVEMPKYLHKCISALPVGLGSYICDRITLRW